MNILTQAVGLLTRVIRTSLAHHKFLYFKYDREAKLCSMSTPIRVTKNLGIPTSAKAAARQHAISSTKTFMINPDNPSNEEQRNNPIVFISYVCIIMRTDIL